jgi:hypothetical protein
MPSRQTPKIRLRHDNSQIKFESIVSSPSNPFNQESQVLTDRQKEMIDRQRLSSGLFANLGAPSPQPEDVPSPMEIHSDALTVDDLPDHASRTTPLKAFAAMGPMDDYLGSSPTPHARKSTRNIVSDDTDLATPTAVRSIQFATNDDLDSSPPRPDVLVGSSFDYGQPESSLSVSFDEGTTIDEEALLEAVAPHDNPQMDSELVSDTVMSELPSSTIDLQLTAQIDADMQTHDAATEGTEEAQSGSNAEFVDASSHLRSSIMDHGQPGSDTEVDDAQTPSRGPARRASRKSSQADTSSTSRVDDSFDTSFSKGTPNALRRSSRHSMGSPARLPSGKKPRRTPAKADRRTKAKRQTQEEPAPELEPAPAQPEDKEMRDNIVVASSPKPTEKSQGKKRKASAIEAPVASPATNRKLNLRRSQSLLSQVENSQDLVADETPAPNKRYKGTADQDVSEAKKTTPGSQTKRLSHVQVSPRPRSSSSSGKPSLATKDTEQEQQEEVLGVGDKPTNTQDTSAPETNAEVEPSRPQNQNQGRSQHSTTDTPTRSFAERVVLTPRSIINQLKTIKNYLFSTPQLVLGRGEEREIDDALFDIRRQVHAAGLRGEEKK